MFFCYYNTLPFQLKLLLNESLILLINYNCNYILMNFSQHLHNSNQLSLNEKDNSPHFGFAI